jgi:hypothetical protein
MDAMGRRDASVIDNSLAIPRSMVCEWYVVFDCSAMESKRNPSESVISGGAFGPGCFGTFETVACLGASIRYVSIPSALLQLVVASWIMALTASRNPIV